MDINTDRVCEACGCDWRGAPACPICGRLDNFAGIVTVCGWCDTRHALMDEAHEQGLSVSHGMCHMHAETLWAEAVEAQGGERAKALVGMR